MLFPRRGWLSLLHLAKAADFVECVGGTKDFFRNCNPESDVSDEGGKRCEKPHLYRSCRHRILLDHRYPSAHP